MFKVKEYVERKLPPVCIAHRGFSSLYPENTLLAFRKAIEAGAQVIELDIRTSKDNELIVFHDPTLKRIADLEVEVSSLKFKELREIDLGLGQRIPSFREVLEVVAGRVGLNIHMYVGGWAIDKVIELCDEKKILDSVFLALPFREEILRIKRDYPDVYACSGYGASREDYIELTLELGAEILQPPFGAKYLTREWVVKAHENNLVVEVFYADTYSNMRRLKRLNVDGVLTNNPPTFFQVFKDR